MSGSAEDAGSLRRLIVNADDFGQDPAFNRGTVRAHDAGVVTSASLMVRWPAAEEAVALAAARPAMSLGIHVDLGEWTCRNSVWEPLYGVVDVHDAFAVQNEVAAQVERFISMVGRPPTHVDSHQHVHREEPVAAVVAALAADLRVPLRDASLVRYSGAFYGQYGCGVPYPQGISPDVLISLVRALEPGTTEIGCHPADAPASFPTMYSDERVPELSALCDARVLAAIRAEGVHLSTFVDVTP